MNVSQIESGQRTIRHMAEYFVELKKSAEHLAGSIDPVGRGYFTATEDDAVQALVVSYWQSRGALLDLIHEFRNYAERDEGEREAAFLSAFAAALILIDAARFLRSLVEGRPVVRKKLNQPVPTFDIGGGTYDTIQKSLLSTRHAWHLYHALQYFEGNQPALRRFAARHELDDVMAVVDRLRERLDISLRQFTRAGWRTRGDQVLRKVGRTLVVRALYGLQKLVAGMMADVYVRPGHEPRIPAEVIRSLGDCVQPGDVLVVRKEYALTNYFLPGYWPHAALYLGRPTELDQLNVVPRNGIVRRDRRTAADVQIGPTVLESMKDGVLIRPWTSPLLSDSFVLLRPQLSSEHVSGGLERALAHEGKPYDFDFDFGRSDRLVCTEVIYRAYEGLGDIRFTLKTRAGRPTLSGADLVEMACEGQNLEAVAVFAPDYKPELVFGSNALAVVHAAHKEH